MSTIQKIIRRIPEAVFIVWVFLFAFLFISNDYLIYLRPSFVFLIIIGFFLSILIFLGGVFRLRIQESAINIINQSLIILIPVLYYIVSNNASLDSFAFNKKRTTIQNTSNQESSNWKRHTVENKDNLNKIEISKLTSPFWDFNGALIETEGQVYREAESPYIAIYRFVITCCAADARPVAIYIPDNEKSQHLKKDEWVQITGRFKEVKVNGRTIKTIEPNLIKYIEQPPKSQIYLYR